MSNSKRSDFFKHISNYLLVFIFLGLWTSFQSFKYKRILQIYATFALLSILILFSFALYSEQIYTFTTISNTVANSLFVLMMSVHLTIIYETFAKSKIQRQLIEKFSHVDELFRTKLKVQIGYYREKSDLFKISFSLLMVIIPTYGAFLTYLCYVDWQNFMFHITYSSLIIRFRIMQTLFFVYLLRNRLNVMNDKLKYISKMTKKLGFSTEQTQHHLSLSLPIEEILMNMKHSYDELFDICELINSAFEYSLLGTVTQNFVDYTSNFYWAFLAKDNPVKCSLYLALMISNLTVLVVFCFYCTSCFQEVI